jgi:hypothetical protein
MRRALAAGALVLLAAGARPPSDATLIAAGPVELAQQAAAVVTGRLDHNGYLAVDRYWKGSGPPMLRLPASPAAARPRGGRVAAFLEQAPGRPGVFQLLPAGVDAGLAVMAVDEGNRLLSSGQPLADVIARAAPERDWRKRLRGGADDPAIRQ